jgi:transketolase
MRTAFINELIRQARLNPRLFLVVGDLGFSVVEPFAKEFPGRYLNAGVAEQNMTSVAAGLASEGYHVFTYSIANFPTLRCLEQIRNDVCYHNLPVTVVAVGAGLAYGNAGYTHHGVQDLAVMRTLPNITVLSPADPGETIGCMRNLCESPRPSYLRLGKAGERPLHDTTGVERGPLAIKPARSRLALAATGSIAAVALDAAREIKNRFGMEIAVYSCPWLKPVTQEFFKPLWEHACLLTLEEHVGAGGFGELLRALQPGSCRIMSLSVREENAGLVGSQEFLRASSGLSVEAVVESARELLV